MAAPTIVIIPALLSLLLGRTIDLANYNIGANIYDDIYYSETKQYSLNSTYYVLEGDKFPYDFFGMPIDVALRIKANSLNSRSGYLGLDGLLKGTSWMHNSAVVAVSTVYRTVNRTLSDGAPLVSWWRERIAKSYTHYASSVTYGGWFVVLYRFRCDIPSDVTSVRKTVIDVLGTSGNMPSNAIELWNLVRQKVMANSDVRGKVVVETYVYSSVNLPVQIDSTSGLLKATKLLPTAVGELGSPLYVKLRPLSEIDSSFTVAERGNVKERNLYLIDRMFDDLTHTRSKLIYWLKNSDDIEEDEEDKVSDLLGKITERLRLFKMLINDLSLYKNDEKDEVFNAIRAYRNGLGDSTDTYYLAYLRLKEDVDTSCEKSFLHGIKGLLKVYENEFHRLGDVGSGGIEACKKKCLDDNHCKAIGYADEVVELDLASGNYIKKLNQCWVYHRSTSTSTVYSPNGLTGDLRVYDRLCL